MIRKLIEWSLNNTLIVVLVSLALMAFGVHAFLNVNVEAYPDPAPPIVEIVATTNGMSAEEVERQVSIPLEVTLAGIPGLKFTRSKSLFGLSHLRVQFEYGTDYLVARQEVINRLQFSQALPPGVSPQLSPQSPTGEIYRYTLLCPKDEYGHDIYTLNDLKALQDWVLERQFRRVPRIIDVSSSGGTVRRYEIHPDPDRLRRYGITLGQLQTAISNSNMNVGGDIVNQGATALAVRTVGIFSGAEDPVRKVIGMKDPNPAAAEDLEKAAKELADEERELAKEERFNIFSLPASRQRARDLKAVIKVKREEVRELDDAHRRRIAKEASKILRQEEKRRLEEIRSLVIASFNNRPVRVEDVVEGGRLGAGEEVGKKGVVVSNQTRLGLVGHTRRFEEGEVINRAVPYPVYDGFGDLSGYDDPDKVQCVVLLRKLEDSLPALKDVEEKVKELNSPEGGRLLPGVKIEPYYDRTELIGVTTETVRENLFVGILLVTAILFMFLSNVRTALIVALNIPLALLFAFSMLFIRGKSANLLSIGAVDFGIIVDSSVIMVENIYRHLASGDHTDSPLKDRILKAAGEIQRPLLFSTMIMVCAFIPLFTMRGPEGQLFGPMADTYAFALCGALVMAVTLTPVLCLFFFKHLKATPDNLLVRMMKRSYLSQLKRCLKYRWVTMIVMGGLIVGTGFLFPYIGNEFMPELEEGNLWIRGTSSLNTNLDRGEHISTEARKIMLTYPEVEQVVNQLGRPDDGTDSAGFYNSEYFVPLKPESEWPAMVEQRGIRRWLYGAMRPRSKDELVKAMNAELEAKLPGTDWNFSQNIRDNVMESLSGVKGDNSVKIFGPDLEGLQNLAEDVKRVLEKIDGIENVGIFDIRGQTNLEFRVDPKKCEKWGVMVSDVNNVIASALGAKALTTMIEGEKLFDVSVRWPKWRRASETSILDIPVDIVNNQVVMVQGPGFTPSSTGTGLASPSVAGSLTDTRNNISITPRLRLGDLVSPVGEDGATKKDGQYVRAGASTIYREQGTRLIALKFSVRGRDLGSAVAEAQRLTKDTVQSPYRMVWSGEFEEMEEAERRLLLIIPLSLTLIFILLFMAFQSLIDAVVVFSNVVALSLGGIWGLWLTNTNFSISAAVGFVSLFGVAIMDGLLLISSFNSGRAHGMPLSEAIMAGAEKRVRPVMMTALTAILGLLPAALSTKIGSQTQRPLAIVVVSGMIATLFLTRYLMPVLYSFYGHREPAEGASSMDH
jgi:cobalt-zinc-cadmium resistance protein CzcA